jgi:hypothetical protein
MTTLSDGIANVSAYTAQIEALKRQEGTTTGNPQSLSNNQQATLLSIQQDFNSMLNTLLEPADSTSDKNKSDPLTAFLNECQSLNQSEITVKEQTKQNSTLSPLPPQPDLDSLF